MRAGVEPRCRTGEPSPAPAATLLALFEEQGQAHVVLIRRSLALPLHAGEIGLPGGRVHAGESMIAAALRETYEEVGIGPSEVEVIGWLERVVGRTSGSVATPIVGLLAARPALVPDPSEVDDAFDVALSDLLADGVYREERWDTPVAENRAVYFFELPEATVWGMTARVLRQLLVLLTGRRALLPAEPPGGPGGTTPPAPS